MSQTTAKPIELERNDQGVFFPRQQRDPSTKELETVGYNGPVRFQDEHYDLELIIQTSRKGDAYYAITGKSRTVPTNTVTGHLHPQEPGVSNNGKPKPSLTGGLTFQPGNIEKKFAAWDRISKAGKPYLSAQVEEKLKKPTE